MHRKSPRAYPGYDTETPASGTIPPSDLPNAKESSIMTDQQARKRFIWRLASDTDTAFAVAVAAVVVVLGVGCGITAPKDSEIPEPWATLSSVVGWTYFAAWSISFWPQVYYNWKRQSVVGLSLDFEVYNLVGFFCYSTYTCAFFWNAAIRRAYEDKYHSSNGVQVNDVFFALHAVGATLLTLAQCAAYDRGQQTVSLTCRVVSGSLTAFCSAYAIAVHHFASDPSLSPEGFFTWLSFLYCLSWVKLLITLIKYVPQVYMNFLRKSTVGWSIGNILLDFTGGSLSIGQSVMDACVRSDWSVILGNPVKMALGFYSILFDIVFMTQHYVLYPAPAESASSEPINEAEPLLPEQSETA